MPDEVRVTLEQELAALLEHAPAHPAADVHTALVVAELLEARGFTFDLKDLKPRSMHSLWRAVFAHGGTTHAAEDADAALAICTAAVDALKAA